LAFDHPADQLSVLVAAGFIAGGFTFILRSRRPRESRVQLFFLSQQKQMQRGMMASIGTMFLLYQGMQSQRPLFWIGAIVVGAVAVWYQWRVHTIRQYDALFQSDIDKTPVDDLESGE
jgi:hypothetical protein